MKIQFYIATALISCTTAGAILAAGPEERTAASDALRLSERFSQPTELNAPNGNQSTANSGDVTSSEWYVAQQPPATTPPGASNPVNPAPNRTQPAQPRSNAAPPDANSLALGPTARNNYNIPSGAPRDLPGYSLASRPHMIGDTLGIQFQFLTKTDGGTSAPAGDVSLGGGNRSVKISEDCSPIPTDRVFFDYNHFHNALTTANGEDINLNQYMFGVEKTFFDGLCSIELKAPLEAGLNDVQSPGSATPGNEGTLFGTLSITPKILLHQSDTLAASTGLAIGLPTSPDSIFDNPQFQSRIRVENQAVHLAPFVGFLYAPNEKLFSITYLQLDFDAAGNAVFSNGDFAGRLHDPTLMYVDTSIGYWLFGGQPAQANSLEWMTGVAPMIELHYTTSLQNAAAIDGIIEPVATRVDILNLTAGMYFQMGPLSSLFVGAVAPLRTMPGDKEFDAEVVVQFNRRF